MRVAKLIAILLASYGILTASTNAYISHFSGNQIDVFDIETNTLLTPILVGNSPEFTTATPDGKTVFVSNTSDSTVSVIDTATNTVIGSPIPVGSMPQYLAVSPDGNTLYVCTGGASAISYIDVASVLSGSPVTGTIPTGVGPNFVGFSIDGSKGYTCDKTGNSITVFSTATKNVIATISMNIGPTPTAIVFKPDGTKAYVSNATTPGSVSLIDLGSNTASYITTNIGNSPGGITITPDGTKVLVANQLSNDISVIDTSTNSAPSPPVPCVTNPFGIAVTQDSSKAFISSVSFGATSMSVYDINAATMSSIVVGGPTTYPTFYPDGTTLLTPLFDASGTLALVAYPSLSVNTVTGLLPFPLWIAIASSSTLQPPTSLQGKKIQNEFLVYTVLLNTLNWQAPASGASPVAYKIYRNAALTDLIGEVPASGPLSFTDQNVSKGESITYFVVAVGASGDLSLPASVTISR